MKSEQEVKQRMKDIIKELDSKPYKRTDNSVIHKRSKLNHEYHILEWVLGWHL